MINIDMDKYEDSVIKSINKENTSKIVSFLVSQGCDYVDELLENYLDIFLFEYDDFVIRFNKLNDKYNHNIINEISDDMNILEEFYYS